MADMMDTLRGLLGDNADEKIKNVMTMLQNSGMLKNSSNTSSPAKAAGDTISEINNDIKVSEPTAKPQQTQQAGGSQTDALPALNADSLQYMMQIKNIVDEMSKGNDSRSNLLRSLRPFMRTDRQRSIDRAIRLMNLSRFSGLFRK